MRRILPAILILLLGLVPLAFTSCGGEGSGTGVGSLIADFDLEGEEYLANPPVGVERLFYMFQPRAAHALASLGFDTNCFPFNQFSSSMTAESGLQVVAVAPDQTLVAQGQTDGSGRVSFTDLPIGYLSLVITGRDGNNYHVPVQVNKDTMSRTRVLVFRIPATGKVFLSAKTIHDADGNGINDDSFSYSVFNRPLNQSDGGSVHLHLEGETKIDANGDGDFIDTEDETIIEPDDDGVASDAGDGDEDNDGLLDNVDPDIDGDGLLNENDPDIDGDGLLNADDPYPDGITPNDDFIPPGLPQGAIYPGIIEVAQIDTGTVSVFFPTGIDDKNPPVTYIIYYSTTSPIDFKAVPKLVFRPKSPGAPDSILSDNVINLITGQTYYFAVRAMDSAQPPNIDHNVNEMSITVQPWS